MKRQPSNGFNKEKLIFLGTAALLASSVYYLLTSQPAQLTPGTMVTSMAQPGPADPEKPSPREADVLYYLDDGRFYDRVTHQPVDRKRKNPFQPLDDWKQGLLNPAVAKNDPTKKNGVLAPPPIAPPPPPPPSAPKVEEKAKEEKVFDPNDVVAKVDFSAVVTMNGQTYGLLKSKDGTTIQVKVGDYIDEFKYTVSKIDKQAIWVTDDDNHLFVARDTTFAEGAASSGDDEKPKKKEKPAKDPKDTKPAVTKPAPAQPPARNNNNNNFANNNNGNNNRTNGRRPRGGSGNDNPFGNGSGASPQNLQNWLKNMGINMGN